MSGILIRYPRVVPILAFGLAILATLMVVVSIEHASRVEQRTEVTERVNALGQDLERRASSAQAYLMSGAALFETGMDVDQQTFNRFAATLQADNDFQGVMALGWSVRMKSSEVAEFERSMQQSGTSGFHTWPRNREEREEEGQFVDAVKYAAPATPESNRSLGFDLRSEPVRRDAVDRASRSGRPAISGRVSLNQAPGLPGVILVAPVYRSASGGSGQGELKGFLMGALRADQFLLASVIGQADTKLDLEVYDEKVAPDRLLYRQGNPIADNAAIVRHAQIADRVWVIKSSYARPGILSQTGMFLLLAGLIIAALLLFIVRLAIQQALFDRYQIEASQEQEAIRATLTRELNHRVKNTLANVLSILSLSRRNATGLDEFVADFDGRVRALSATYNLLTQTSWGATSVISIVRTEMAPYFESDPPRITLDGEDALIAPNDALSLGMLIHELFTNAAKFGALSNSTGRISLCWRPSDEHLLFDWEETGGPPPPQDRQRGFGSDLIEKVLSRELNSAIRIKFADTGAQVSFRVPLRQLNKFALSRRHSVEG